MTDKNIQIKLALIAAVLLVVTVAAYVNVWNHDFINFDDDIYVTDNQIVSEGLTLKGIKWALGFNQRGYWQPLTWLSHMLDCELYGLNPAGHHFSNLILHLSNMLLLFWGLYRMTGSVYKSAFVAGCFALHPLNVDSVAWIAERKNLLSTFFWLLCLVSYQRYTENPRPRHYMLTIILYALGLMAKPMIVTLPFVFLLLDFWPLKRLRLQWPLSIYLNRPQTHGVKELSSNVSKLIIEKLPFFAISFCSVWLSIASARQFENMAAANTVPMTLRLSNALVSYASYIKKMFWPLDLAVFYPYPESIALWRVAGAGVLLTAITGFCLFWANRKSYLAVGWFWYLGTLVPVLGIVRTGLWPEMADRWAYLPLIGLFVIITWGTADALRNWQLAKPVISVAATAVFGTMFFLTQTQLQYWKNSQTLFAHALEVTSENTVVHNNLGNALLEKGRVEEAYDHFQDALKIEPRHAGAHNNLANALMNLNRVDEAVDHYLASLKKAPWKAKTHNNLAVALTEKARLDEAILHLQEALRLKPNYAEAYSNLGAVYRKKAQVQKAAKFYLEAIRLRPDFSEAYNNLGLLLWREGRLKDADHYFSQALEHNPEFLAARENLVKIRSARDVFNRQVAEIQSRLQQSPEDPALYLKLGDLYKAQGRLNDSLKQYQTALQIRPDFLPAQQQLAVIYAMRGEYNKAIELLERLAKHQADNIEICYYLAGIYARKNKIENSIYWLKKAIAKGYKNWNELKNDRNFDSIRETANFQALVPAR